MNTGDRIREARKRAGLTQKRLGELCGIAEPTIRRYELGKLNPKIETLKKIAEPLGVFVFELYGDEETELYKQGVNKGVQIASSVLRIASEEEVLKPYRDKGYQFTDEEALFIAELNHLNDFGQLFALNCVREVAKYRQYRNMEDDDNAPQDNP